MKRLIVVIALLALMAGCSDPNATINSTLNPKGQKGRMKTVSAQTFFDAGGKVRDILVLQDSTTDKEYLVVMGGGVLELVSNGKYLIEQ